MLQHCRCALPCCVEVEHCHMPCSGHEGAQHDLHPQKRVSRVCCLSTPAAQEAQLRSLLLCLTSLWRPEILQAGLVVRSCMTSTHAAPAAMHRAVLFVVNEHGKLGCCCRQACCAAMHTPGWGVVARSEELRLLKPEVVSCQRRLERLDLGCQGQVVDQEPCQQRLSRSWFASWQQPCTGRAHTSKLVDVDHLAWVVPASQVPRLSCWGSVAVRRLQYTASVRTRSQPAAMRALEGCSGTAQQASLSLRVQLRCEFVNMPASPASSSICQHLQQSHLLLHEEVDAASEGEIIRTPMSELRSCV